MQLGFLAIGKLTTASLLDQWNARLPQKLFSSSLDRLQICQVELQQDCFFSGALLELADSSFTLGLVTARNIDFGVFCEEDLRINTSV